MLSDRKHASKLHLAAALTGLCEIVAGTVLLVLVLSGSSPAKLPLTVLFMLLILVGFYGIVFQPLIYRKRLHRAVTEQYKSADYFKNDVTVELYPERIVESYADERHVFRVGGETEGYELLLSLLREGGEPADLSESVVDDVKAIRENELCYLFETGRRTVILPKNKLEAFTAEGRHGI